MVKDNKNDCVLLQCKYSVQRYVKFHSKMVVIILFEDIVFQLLKYKIVVFNS